MIADRPVLGVLLMLGFCILAPAGDSIAKLLGATVPLLQLLMVRFGLQAVLLLPVIVASGRRLTMSPRVAWLTVARTLLHITGVGAMFLSLRFLPLADAVAIAFVMPFIMLLLGRFVLKEEVGSRRLAACAVGFIGTLLVVQPSFSEVGAPALLPLLVAVDFALFMLVTRQIAKDIDPVSLQALSGAMAVADIVKGGTTTSSPGEIPAAPTAAMSPEVAELTDTACLLPKRSAHRASKDRTRGPPRNSGPGLP